MTGPDPAAATAAWLSHIPSAAQAAAERHAELQVIGWALGWIGPVLLAVLLLRSGLVERAQRAGGGLAAVLLLALAGSVWALLVQAVESGGPPVLDAGGFCVGVAGRFVLFAAGWGLLRLAGGRPRLLLGGLALAAGFLFVFGPIALSEAAGDSAVPASGPAAAAALELARASGVQAARVEVSASAPGEGDVTGLFQPPRILLRPEAASRASLAEVRAGVGHVLGHWRAHDNLGWAAVLAGVGVLGGLFVVGLYRPAARLLGGRGSLGPRFRTDEREKGLAEPRALPVLWALTAVWTAVALPAAFAWDRSVNLRADRFSLEHAHEPDALASVLIRENGQAPVDPPALELWLVCNHPPLKARIEQAMRWKADQAGTQAR